MNNSLSMSVFASHSDFEKACRRHALVTRLTNDFADTLWNHQPTRVHVAEFGFPGFATMTDKELEKAAADAGLPQ